MFGQILRATSELSKQVPFTIPHLVKSIQEAYPFTLTDELLHHELKFLSKLWSKGLSFAGAITHIDLQLCVFLATNSTQLLPLNSTQSDYVESNDLFLVIHMMYNLMV